MKRRSVRGWLSKIVARVDHEWVLDHEANGGDIILFRSVLVTAQTYLAVIVVKNIVDPDTVWSISWHSIRKEFLATAHYLGPLMAAVYAALYSRFASQWEYLAGIYNRVKEAEVRRDNEDYCPALAEWKAGFIHDAWILHLAGKPTFALTILAWADDEHIAAAYRKRNPDDGPRPLHELIDMLKKRYKGKSGSHDKADSGESGSRPRSAA